MARIYDITITPTGDDWTIGTTYTGITADNTDTAITEAKNRYLADNGEATGDIDGHVSRVDGTDPEQLPALRTFEELDPSGFRWSTIDYATDKEQTYRTGPDLTGLFLWRDDGTGWNTALTTAQFQLPPDPAAAIAYLLAQWGLVDEQAPAEAMNA